MGLTSDLFDGHGPFSQFQSGFQGIGEPASQSRPGHQPVHHHGNGVFLLFVQLDFLIQGIQVVIHLHPHVSCPADGFQDVFVFPFPALHHRCQDHEFGSFRQFQHLVGNLLGGLAFDDFPALGTMGDPDPGKQQPEIVVDLRYRSHRGPGVPAGGLLVDGNGRGQSPDIVHIRFVHLSQELPGIGRQAFHVPALAFRIDGIKGQGGFPAAGQTGDHHQFVPGDVQGYILQVVLPRPLDYNDIFIHELSAALLSAISAGPGIPRPVRNPAVWPLPSFSFP